MRTTGPGQPAHLLLDAVEILNKHNVPYAVVGAFAASYHGLDRATKDADAVISLPKSSIPALESDFQNAGFITKLSRGAMDDPIAAVLILSDQFENRVDLLYGVRGMEAGVLPRTVTARLLGEEVRMIGAEDFVAMKISAGGYKDLDDVRGVLRVSKEKIDLALLKDLTKRYGRDELRVLNKILKETGF